MQNADVLKFLEDIGYRSTFYGDRQTQIDNFCALSELRDCAVTWIKKATNLTPEIKERLKTVRDVLIITGDPALVGKRHSYIVTENPKGAFFRILERFFLKLPEPSVAEDSVVETRRVGANVAIGHHCFINEAVEIEDNVWIGNNVSIVCPCRVGEGTILHSGVVIGTDGFGYYEENGVNRKVPHFGGVTIGRDVEIGANSCIDRGTMTDTVLCDNVKIDNLCHIGHNAYIGENSLLTAMSVLGGSCRLEKNSYIGINGVIRNQIRIGENAFVGMGAVVTKSVEDGKLVAGVPAKVLRENG